MKNFSLLAATIIWIPSVFGQFSITSFNSSNTDLPSNFLGSVTIDRYNVVWFGDTEYEGSIGGIFRYDGLDWSFTKLEEDTSKPGINHIFDIQFGPGDDMWVYTYGQNCRITKVDSMGQADYTPGHIFGSEGFSYNRSIWFIDWWTGLYEYNYDSLRWIFHNNFPVDPEWSPITTFKVDRDGIYWLGIGNKNIYRWKDTILSKIELFPEYPPKYKLYYTINDVAFAPDSSIWFATNEGLIHYINEANFTTYNTDNSNLPSNSISHVLIDQRGYIWCNIWQEGLGLLKGPKQDFILYNENNSELGKNEIRSIAEDNDRNIWIATWGGGATKVYLNTSSLLSPQPSPLISLFPNPAEANKDLVIICDAKLNLVELSIISSQGTLIDQFELDDTKNQHIIRLPGILPGNYFTVSKDVKGITHTNNFSVIK